jgi:nicotinamidase-related amidase
MLLSRDTSALLIVDLQERLLPHIHDGETVLAHAVWLLGVARHLGVPVVVTEQYPAGLGPTTPALRTQLHANELVEKVHFSCVAEGSIQRHPAWKRSQFVVAGTEAHVCVLQTVLGMIEAGKQVFVVAEAVGSRKPSDRSLGLDRMRACGAQVVSREMVAFEWLGRAATDEFREMNRRFIR